MASRRSTGRGLRRILGRVFLFSGLWLVWIGIQVVNGWLVLRRANRYFDQLVGLAGGPIPRGRFPMAYFQARLHPGMSVSEVDRLVFGARKERLDDWLAVGDFAHVYTFPFGFAKKHQLYAFFDAQSRLVHLDSRHLSLDLR